MELSFVSPKTDPFDLHVLGLLQVLLVSIGTVIDPRRPFIEEGVERHVPVPDRAVQVNAPVVDPFLVAAVAPVADLRVICHHADRRIVLDELARLRCEFLALGVCAVGGSMSVVLDRVLLPR